MARRKAKATDEADYLAALQHFYKECATFLKTKTLEHATGPDLRKMEMSCLTLERATLASSGPTDKMSEFQQAFMAGQDESRIDDAAAATVVEPDDLPVAEAVTKTLEAVYLAEDITREADEVASRLADMEARKP